MAFIPVPNTAMVELLYTWDGQQCENTMYFEGAAPWTDAQLTTLADMMNDWWIAELQTPTSNTVTFRGTKATSLESDTAPSVELAPPTLILGANNNPSLPNNVSIAIKFGTAGRGRSARGRNYIVGLTEEKVTGNQLDAAAAAIISDAYNSLRDLEPPNSSQQVVVSRFTGGAPRTTGVTFPVTSATFTDLVIDSQRRRLPGRGT